MHSIVPVVAVEVAEVLIRKICIVNFTVHTIFASHNLHHVGGWDVANVGSAIIPAICKSIKAGRYCRFPVYVFSHFFSPRNCKRHHQAC